MIRTQIQALLNEALARVVKDWGINEKLSCLLEIPQDESHGDFATNVAMTSAKLFRKSPCDIARALIDALQSLPATSEWITKIELAGPGFINVTVAQKAYVHEVKQALQLQSNYGRSTVGQKIKVRVEFVSANPTGPLHVGHGRGAVIGDVLASILDFFGYDVTREYYLNDCGNQMNILGKTARAWTKALAEGQEPAFLQEDPGDGSWYRGDYMKDIAQKMSVSEDEDDFTWGRSAGQLILEIIQKDLCQFGVKPFDLWSSEKDLHDSGEVQKVIDVLKEKGLIVEREGAQWFLSATLGDEKDRVVVKSDGQLTYLAADIAFHHLKFQEGYAQVIDIWGADHHGYVARVKAAIESLEHDREQFYVILCQLVRLMRSEEVVPMSTRSGEFITLRQIVEEVGKDVARYFFLMRKADAHLDFDLDVAKQQSMDNPVYYIQYAHARICSILKNFEEQCLTEVPLKDIVFEELKVQEELTLMKILSRFQETIEACARTREVYYLAAYLRDLAAAFHSFYRQCRVITENQDQTQARLALVKAAQVVLKNGLDVLGLSAPSQM